MSKNPPDRWARFFAGLGITIGVCGLLLTYYNNRWQKEVYEKGLEERIFVQLSGQLSYLSYPLINLVPSKNGVPSKGIGDPPKGELAVEVVNFGLQPIYLKRVTAQVGEQSESFYEHDPLNTTEPLRRLEPGEAASYKVKWWASLTEDIDKAHGHATVEVETTKKRFTLAAQINRVTVVADLPLSGHNFQEFRRLMPSR